MSLHKDSENFERIKNDAEKHYSSIKDAYCPYLKTTVAFNEKGWNHLRFKRVELVRSRADQIMRLRYIPFAARILEKSRTLQEFKQIKEFEKTKTEGKRGLKLQRVKYFGFVSIIRDEFGMKRFKVIVRQVEDGAPYFWSIIPFWRNAQEPKMHSGDLQMD